MKRTSFIKKIPGFLRSSSVEYLKSNGFKDPDSLLDEAAALSLDHKDLEKFRRRHFTNKDGSVNMELQAAFARVHTVERTVSSYMPILERLALEAECGASAENLKNHIQALKNSGMPLDQTVLIFNKLLKIAPSLTPHPTENLAPAGITLLQALLDAAGGPAAGRNKAIETAIKALFDAPVFGAVRKATVLDEVRQARIYKLAHIKAVNEFDRRLEDALEAAYGTRPKINSNTALRNWDKDTDGKDNSEGFAMLAQLAMDQVDSLTLALDNIDAALDDPACPAPLKELADKFKTVRNVVGPIYEGAGNAVEVLALLSPEERAKAYPLMYDRHFKGLKRKLSGAYEGIGDKMRGLGLYRESCKILGAERENPALSQEARAGLDEAFRTIQKLGFALSKSQTRISYNVYMRMLDNLFTAQPQPAILHKILTDEELDDIAASGGFSSIADPEQQRVLLNEMYHNIQRQGLEKNFYKTLRAANPMVMAASGFPDQGFSVCDVLDMRAVFQLMYEEGIISDGGPCSFEIQKLMGLVSGNGLMKHMPLFENLDTYMQASDLSEKFMALDAGESGQFRVLHIPAGIGTGFKGYSVIIPASDSAKEGGDGAKLVGLIGERTLFAHTIKRGEAVQQMNGAGTSLNRSIGDPAIIRRMGAQELKKHLMSRGAVLNLAEPQ
ncbi:MAG TPA: hypothetical protein PLO23_04900, partial [Alphaproteobacteria bacterium]|nr:hypothetical protein [Alphaproteobacteria bacterium]